MRRVTHRNIETIIPPETLGSCGCTDYHMADCPIRTHKVTPDQDDYYEEDYRPNED